MTALIIAALVVLIVGALWLAFEGITAPEGDETPDGYGPVNPREWRD